MLEYIAINLWWFLGLSVAGVAIIILLFVRFVFCKSKEFTSTEMVILVFLGLGSKGVFIVFLFSLLLNVIDYAKG